jgi:hypothetical protein
MPNDTGRENVEIWKEPSKREREGKGDYSLETEFRKF